ncbi:MAG: DUF1707 SHOCT-like domain-containing protein, partial [Acidimicrobiales bacterium]
MVVVLRGHLLAGRLTLDEFSERVGVAYGARTGSDLAVARHDLPDVPGPVASGRQKPVRFTGALFAHVVRRGRFTLGRRTVIVGAFSDVDLDLREAAIGGARATVAIFVLFGNVYIYLPEGLAVDTAGVTVFGHRREWGREAAWTVAPTVKVRVLGSFAT